MELDAIATNSFLYSLSQAIISITHARHLIIQGQLQYCHKRIIGRVSFLQAFFESSVEQYLIITSTEWMDEGVLLICGDNTPISQL